MSAASTAGSTASTRPPASACGPSTAAKAGYRTNPLVAEDLVLLGNRDGTFYAVHAHGTPAGRHSRLEASRPRGRSTTRRPIRTAWSTSPRWTCTATPPRRRRQAEVADREAARRGFPFLVAGRLAGPGRLRHHAQLPQRPEPRLGELRSRWPAARRILSRRRIRAIFGGLGEQDYSAPPARNPATGPRAPSRSTPPGQPSTSAQKPWRRMLYCLDAADRPRIGGRPRRRRPAGAAPFLWTGSKNGTPRRRWSRASTTCSTATTTMPRTSGARSHISGWKFGTPFVSRITSDYGASDEPHIASGGGKYLYWSLCGDRESGWIDLSKPWPPARDRSREGPIFPGYHLYQACPGYDEMWFGVGDQDGTGNRLWGYYGSLNGIYHNQTDDQNPFVPYQGSLYIHRSNAVICFGPEGGGRKQPRARRCPRRRCAAGLERGRTEAMLDREISKWLDAGHLQPGYFNASQFGHTPGRYRGLNNYFDNPAENLWVLLRACLTCRDLKAPLREFIQKEFAAFPPPSWPASAGRRPASRDYLPLSAGGRRGAELPAQPHGDPGRSWRGALPPLDSTCWRNTRGNSAARRRSWLGQGKLAPLPPEGDWPLYPYEINAYIAGHLGYLELEKLAGQPESSEVRQTLDQTPGLAGREFLQDTPFPSQGP